MASGIARLHQTYQPKAHQNARRRKHLGPIKILVASFCRKGLYLNYTENRPFRDERWCSSVHWPADLQRRLGSVERLFEKKRQRVREGVYCQVYGLRPCKVGMPRTAQRRLAQEVKRIHGHPRLSAGCQPIGLLEACVPQANNGDCGQKYCCSKGQPCFQCF